MYFDPPVLIRLKAFYLYLMDLWDRTSLDVLKKLGFNVQTIQLPNAYADIPGMIRQVGEWTHEEQKAEQLIQQSETLLTDLQQQLKGKKPINAFIFCL